VALNITVWRCSGKVRRDVADVVDEAHVEHAVGLVEHQHFHVGQHGLAVGHVVHQAAGRGDEQVQRAAKRLELRAIGHAADDSGHTQAGDVAAVGVCRLGHLHHQFARRREHQHARAVDHAALAPLGRVAAGGQHALQRRQHEGRGLAAAGGRRHAQVRAGQSRRNGARLHVGGLLVAGVAHGTGQGLGQAQGIEAHR
jgi:hypothetical protein